MMKKKILSGLLALTMLSGLSAVPVLAEEAPEVTKISDYDTLISEHTCETTSISDNLTIEDGAPDGSKYIRTGDAGNNKYGEYCFQSEFSYGANTKEDVMFTVDVKFDADGSGLCVEDNGDAKVAGAVKNNGGKIAIQRSSSDYTTTTVAVDTTAWYHIALIGRYSAADANVDMYVWKYNQDGTMEYLLKQANISLRNLAASNNNGASHLNVLPNTSVDNMRVYKLGADALALSSASDSIKAGETMPFTYSATRAGEYITSPDVTWAVYDENNSDVLDDENITISDSGLLSIGANASSQIINIRAATDSGVYASKAIQVNAVDTSNDTYDNVTLSADKTTVRAGSPLTITATTTLGGAEVTPGADDLLWKICNAENLRELNNKNITIEDGVLKVTEDAVPQTVTVKAVNASGSVSGTYQVQVLPANMNYGNEDDYSDTFVSSDACEEYISGATLNEGSWDGSGYYSVTAAYDFAGFDANTNEDVIYSADMQFANDGAGWTVYNSSKGKLGLQLSSSGTTLNAIGASNSATALMTIEKDAWYNIQVMCATGNASSGTSYARFIAYKYDENGNKVNPKTGEAGVPLVSSDIKLRNLDESQANHININAGTNVDNVVNYKISPDTLTLTLDASTVLAGGSAQASTTASRKGVDFPFLSTSLIKYEVYDADNRYPIGDDKITIDSNGRITVSALADAQDVYIRVSSVSGGMYDSAKLIIKSSDIFEVTSVGFNEDYSVLQRINVNKNFYYQDDVTFISAVYGSDGAMKSIATRKVYGDQLILGSNKIAMNMDMPSDFNSSTDSLNVFALTKLSTSSKTDGADITVTSDSSGIILSDLPEFDQASQIVVLVLAPGADDTKVTDADIAYFNQISSDGISSNSLAIPAFAASGTVIKLCGKVNGMQTIAVGTLQ